MEPNIQQSSDMSVDEAISTLLSELPKPVQDFVTGPERARIALSLSQKYQLHVDQAGAFEVAYMHMLLGISSPEEFVDTLTKAGIAAETVRNLANDVNEQVFVPLRKAEQAPPAPVIATPPPAPAAPILPGSTEPVPQQVVPPPTHHYPVPAAPLPHTLIYPPYAVPYGTPMYMMPVHHPQQWVAPPVAAPLPEQPVPTPPVPVQPSTPIPVPPLMETRPIAPPVQLSTPIQKEYSADPYREPFTQ